MHIHEGELKKHLQGANADKSYFYANNEEGVRALLKNHCSVSKVVDEEEDGNQISCYVNYEMPIDVGSMMRGSAHRAFFTYWQMTSMEDMKKPEFKNGPFIYNLFPKS